MAGFNNSLSLNERQSRSNEKHHKSLRLVLFFPLRCCFAGSLPFSSSTMKQTKLFHSIPEMFFTFLARKTVWVKLFSLNVFEAALQAAIKAGILARNTHLCGFWLDVKKHGSLLWLARTNLRTKIYDISFLVSISLAPCKGIRIPESRNFLLVESGILGFGIRYPALRIRNPTKDWNPESNLLKIHSRLNWATRS